MKWTVILLVAMLAGCLGQEPADTDSEPKAEPEPANPLSKHDLIAEATMPLNFTRCQGGDVGFDFDYEQAVNLVPDPFTPLNRLLTGPGVGLGSIMHLRCNVDGALSLSDEPIGLASVFIEIPMELQLDGRSLADYLVAIYTQNEELAQILNDYGLPAVVASFSDDSTWAAQGNGITSTEVGGDRMTGTATGNLVFSGTDWIHLFYHKNEHNITRLGFHETHLEVGSASYVPVLQSNLWGVAGAPNTYISFYYHFSHLQDWQFAWFASQDQST